MAKSRYFKFILPVKYIASVNKLHIPVLKRVRGRMCPLIIKSPEARKAMEDYAMSLAFYLPKESFGDKSEFTNLDIVYGFYLKELFYKRDTSNAIKIFEDALSRYIGFNDSQVVSTHCYKRLLDYGEKTDDLCEYIYVGITTNTKKAADLRMDPGSLPAPGFIETGEIDGDGEEKKPKGKKKEKISKKDVQNGK